MREILFRGKRVDNGEWVYGYYMQDGLDNHYIIELKNKEDKDYYYGKTYRYIEVIPETIGKYTGLKDKNDKKIFEGDILRDYGNDIEDWIVSYEYGGFVGTFDNVCENLYEISDLEVIGNIYEGDTND